MRSRQAGGTDAARGAPIDRDPARAGVPAIALLLLAGLALRLIIAYVLLPGSGFKTDLTSFTSWANTLSNTGPGGFYANAGFADYTPGYLYVLWLVGLAGQALAGVTGGDAYSTIGNLIKIPPILIDAAVAYLLYRTVLRWGLRDAGVERPWPRLRQLALLAAALWMFNPVTIYDASVWGQVDAFGALILLAAVLFLVDGNSEVATGLTALAGLTKPQFGVVLAPVVAVILIRRHLYAPGSGPRPSMLPRFFGPARFGGWFHDEQGFWRIVSSLAVALGVLIVVVFPFNLGIAELARVMFSAAGEYHYLTVNAYNGWALVGDPGGGSLAQTGLWSDDTVALIGPIPGVVIGAALLVIGFGIGLLQAAWRDSRRSLLLTIAYVSLAFFVLPTRVHERYLFPVFVFLPLLAIVSRRWLVALGVLAIASFMNLHGILTIPDIYATPNLANAWLGPEFRSFWGVLVSAVAQTAVFVVMLAALDPVRALVARVRGARPGDAPETALAAPPGFTPSRPDRASPDAASVARDRAVAAARATSEGPAPRTSRAAAPEPEEFPLVPLEEGGAGFLARLSAGDVPGTGWLVRSLRLRSVRADRSSLLAREGGGRIDRLDLFMVGVLLITALATRTWRLEEPYGMHFDEVYHARTATEFLQDWRYGIPHDIYEFTHPHLAKYAIAAGLVLFGNDQVTEQSSLGTQVAGAAIETRWSPPATPAERDGDRLYVATGTEVRAYDLQGRGWVATIPVAGATAVSVDEDRHVLWIGTADGSLWSVQTSQLDAIRARPPGGTPTVEATRLGTSGAGGPVKRILATGDSVLALTDTGTLVSLDAQAGTVLGTAASTSLVAMLPLDAVDRVVVDGTSLTDPAAAGSALASALGDTTGRVLRLVESAGRRQVVVAAYLTQEQTTAVNALMPAYPGIQIASGPMVAASGPGGLHVLDGASLDQVLLVPMTGQVGGMVLTSGITDKPQIYVAAGPTIQIVDLPAGSAPVPSTTPAVTMPGPVTDVAWDQASDIIHALGRTPDGSSETVYVVEPHGNAVFADARLPFTPSAWVLDQQPDRPASDRQELLALSSGGTVAVVPIGSHAFAWRIIGVIAGALMLACLYLLARVLFRRRSVALFVGAIGLVDGMFFANSRIAMNDTYVAFFIVAAFLVFAALYLGRWRGWSALVVGLPLLGVLLGLALASKWVGAYVMGGMVLLVLLRSALGRLIALAGMIVLSGVLGWLSIAHDPTQDNPQANVLFLLLMAVLTFMLAAAIVWRPIRFTLPELRFAVVAPLALAALCLFVIVQPAVHLFATGPLSERTFVIGGVGMVALSAVALVLPLLARRFGIGPLAAPPDPDDPRAYVEPAADPPSGWLLPGDRWGIPWVWGLLCLTLVPLVVYVISYIPWAQLPGNQLWPGVPAGHTGQTLWDLTISMYNYHNDLRLPHAASSPWWAWPFDLKPVWFYQGSFANDTAASIYDSGNLVLFWLAVPAVAWTWWQAWRRRSLALTLVSLAIAVQWIAWIRIDRATFQYHVFATLPFAYLALAYFLAELWHGPGVRTWMLARAGAALAFLGAPLLWIFRVPLCSFAGTARVYQNSQTCGAVTGEMVISERVAWSVAIGVIGLIVILWQYWLLDREPSPRAAGGSALEAVTRRYGWLAVTVGAVLVALWFAQTRFADTPFWEGPLGAGGPYVLALIVGAVLLVPAWLVLNARDPRRFALGAIIAGTLWFVIIYPNISALPLPGSIVNAYQGLIPTWIYDFQFAVNTDKPANAGIMTMESAVLIGAVAAGTLAVLYAAWAWRLDLAVRRAARAVPRRAEGERREAPPA